MSGISIPINTASFAKVGSNLSSFTNDSGFITNSSAGTLTLKTGNISQWTNDVSYMATNVSNDILGQVGAVASVVTYTTPNDGVNHQVRVGGYVTITSVTLDVLQLQVTYTDEISVSRTQLFFPQGLTSASLGTVGTFMFPTMDIRVAPNTAVTLKTILTTGTGSIAYDAGGSIQKIN